MSTVRAEKRIDLLLMISIQFPIGLKLLHYLTIKKVKRSKVKEIIVLIKARSFLDELNLEHLTS